MVDYVAFQLTGQGRPTTEWALRYGRALAADIGYTVPDGAEPTILQAPDGSDLYRVEVPVDSARPHPVL